MRGAAVKRRPAEAPADAAAVRELVRYARQARRRAHAPFSGFAVGAALRTARGEIVTGCNIENATYGLTLCAERVAVFKAVSEGLGPFSEIAVVARSKRTTPPCGPCRQILWEFCGDLLVHMAGTTGPAVRSVRLSALFPEPFDAGHL